MPEDVKPVETPKPDMPAAPLPAAAPKKGMSKNAKIVIIVVSVVVGLMILGTIATFLLIGSIFNSAGVDVNDGQVTVQTQDGEATTNYGEDVQLAEGWPTDVPIYSPSTLQTSTKVDSNQFSASANTASSITDVAAYYKSTMAAQGWATNVDSTSTDNALITFQKGDRTAGVILSNNPDATNNEKTVLVVTVTTQAQ